MNTISEQILLDVASIGWGVQSTWIMFAAGFGEIPKADKYYFADLKRESQEVYDYQEYAIPLLKNLGIEVQHLSAGDIYKEILNWPIAERVSMIPVWFLNESGKPQPLNRQCTMDYKINTIATAIRTHLNVERLKRHTIRIWQGISSDEIKRAKKAKLLPDDRNKYRVNHYPFISQYANITYPEFNWKSKSREQIIQEFKNRNLKIPPKSSCFFCPFHTIEYWHHIYKTQPKEWQLACILDDSIRHYNNSNETLKNGPFFLYKGLIPLSKIDFDKELKVGKTPELIEGCTTGFCFF